MDLQRKWGLRIQKNKEKCKKYSEQTKYVKVLINPPEAFGSMGANVKEKREKKNWTKHFVENVTHERGFSELWDKLFIWYCEEVISIYAIPKGSLWV